MIGSEQPVQLNPPLPVITPLGPALAYFIWGVDRLVWYGCFQDATGENWWFLNNHVRMCISMSDGQFATSPIRIPKELAQFLAPHVRRNNPIASDHAAKARQPHVKRKNQASAGRGPKP